ncbi:hypothetical protein TNCV_1785261 [Trichonephila clavipes]|nr:hypothetical protein TNCV_1785261 [Trichonephila clavipes]
MEADLAFTLHLALYQEANLGENITFMMNFRTNLNSLKPSEPPDLDSHYLEQEAAKGKGAFIQALWTHYAIPKLYGADLGDFINFMVLLRSHVNTLKPSEIIALGSPVHLVEKIRQLFPHLDLPDFPSLEPYAYLEPVDLFHDYLEQEARKGKGAFIQAV